MSFINEDRYLTDDEMLNNAKLVYDYLHSKGWSDNAIYATLGNMQEESNINPGLSERGGDGYGLVQWTPSHIIKNWLDAHGKAHNDGYGQLDKILEEVHDGSQWIKTSGYNLTFEAYTHSNESLEYLVNAFICNYERPATTHHPIRVAYATNWSKKLKATDYTENINNAVQWAVNIANDDSHGYDQNNRWGTDYDCSSLVIQAYENAGILVKTNGATYTGNIPEVFMALGFQNIISEVNISTGEGMKKGDVILASSHHVALYVGDYNGLSNQVVSAHINELGHTTGGQKGDQTGHEIDVSDYYTFSDIDYVLRLVSSSPIEPPQPPQPPKPTEGEVYKDILKTPYNIKQLSQEQINFLKTLSYGDSVKMLFTFNRKKRDVGKNFIGNRLTFDNNSYIIKSVTNNGFIKIGISNDDICLKRINPKYIKEV